MRFGVARRRKTLSLRGGLDEPVDIGLRPLAVHLWQRGKTNRLKTPPLLTALTSGFPRGGLGDVRLAGLIGSRVGSAHHDPCFEITDHQRGQFRTILGHFKFLVLVADRPEQQALIRLAGDDHRSAITALDQAAPPIQRQAALGLVAAVVALVAMLGEDGSNVFLEKLDLLRRGISHQANCRKTKRQ